MSANLGPTRFVLDSFPLLALFGREKGASEVEQILDRCKAGDAKAWLSMINYGEVVYLTERRRGLRAAHHLIALIDRFPVEVIEVDRTMVFEAAHLKARFRISYADAFAAALARSHQAHVVTGDPEFRELEGLVDVHWIEKD